MEIEYFEETEKKNANVTPRCEKMLNDATNYYIEKNLPEQAIELATRFKHLVKIIEIMPGIGTPWKNGIRTAIIKKITHYSSDVNRDYRTRKLDLLSVRCVRD